MNNEAFQVVYPHLILKIGKNVTVLPVCECIFGDECSTLMDLSTYKNNNCHIF